MGFQNQYPGQMTSSRSVVKEMTHPTQVYMYVYAMEYVCTHHDIVLVTFLFVHLCKCMRLYIIYIYTHTYTSKYSHLTEGSCNRSFYVQDLRRSVANRRALRG